MTCGGKSVEMLQTCSVATMAAVKGKFIMNFFFQVMFKGSIIFFYKSKLYTKILGE